ncbi:MAG: hypothetical protein ABIV21_06670 [Pyrinomonadaceae bacterium]
MRTLLSIGFIFFALTFCGLGERLKGLTGSPASNSNTAGSSASSSTSTTTVEQPKLTAGQQAIQDGGTVVNWDDQGIGWTLPKSWKKMDVKKEQFLYTSPDNASLIGTISVMPDNFPMSTSLDAYYDQAVQLLKQGKYESVKMLEIDRVKGVEFKEVMPEDKDGPRRHQWIGYRNYLGQQQQVNIMLATKGTNFEKHRDDFPAILYSMKFVD